MAKTKKFLFVFIFLIISFSFAMAMTASYAYFQSSAPVRYTQDINSTDVVFTVNNQGIAVVSSYEHILGAGDETTLELDIKVTAEHVLNNEAQYDFNLDLITANEYYTLFPDATKLSKDDSYYAGELARAVEVYEYINGYYEYISNLDTFTAFQGTVPVSHPDRTYSHKRTFKLVYSQAAGTYYEDKGFLLNISATSTLLDNGQNDRIYITSGAELISLIYQNDGAGIVGKTIVLNNNVVLDDSYELTTFIVHGKFGIDLNGYKFTISDKVTFTMDYSASYDPNLSQLGIYDSVPTDANNPDRGIDGKLSIIPHASDFIYIQDNLYTNDNIVVASAYSYNGVIDQIKEQVAKYAAVVSTVGSNENPQFVDLFKNLSYYIGTLTLDVNGDSNLNATHTVNSATTFARGSITLDLLTMFDVAVLVYDATSKRLKINPYYDEQFTHVTNILIAATHSQQSTSFDVDMTVRGNAGDIVATDLLTLIPDSFDTGALDGLSGNYITSSLFLPVYDESSKASITWVTSNAFYFDENGRYLPVGRDYLLSVSTVAEVLDNWGSVIIKLGVLVDSLGVQYYAEKKVVVQVFSAEERTQLLYNRRQLLIEEEFSILDLRTKNFDTGAGVVSYEDKSLFTGLGIKLSGYENKNFIENIEYLDLVVTTPSGNGVIVEAIAIENDQIVLTNVGNLNTTTLATTKTTNGAVNTYTAEHNGSYYTYSLESFYIAGLGAYTDYYLEITSIPGSGSKTMPDVYYKTKLARDDTIRVPTDFTFFYDNTLIDAYSAVNNKYGGNISYTVSQVVTAVGYHRTLELFDAESFLQADFTYNGYITGQTFEFYVKAYTPRGAYTYYSVESPNANLITIQNGIFRQLTTNGTDIDPAEGKFFKLPDGTYGFITTRYDYDDDGAPLYSDNGQYFVYNNTEYDYIQALADGNIYTYSARIRVNPALLPPVEQVVANIRARLFANVDEDGAPKKDSDGNIIWLTQTDENGDTIVVQYFLDLVLNGIYHNIDSEIASLSLYNTLKTTFDTNKNGYIEVKEAQRPWSEINSKITLMGVSNLKGLEYFTTIEQLAFSGSSVKDISALSELRNLSELDASGNAISDLSPLSYLDSLIILNVGSNNIHDLTPIQYLQSIQELNISNNQNIADYAPIIEYRALKTFNAYTGNAALIASNNAIYAFALISINNPGVKILGNGGQEITTTAEQKVAALLLSQFITIVETRTTIHAPNIYYYPDTNGNLKKYKIRWSVVNASDQAYFNFIEDNNSTTIGYEIHAPVINREISINIMVVKDDSNDDVLLARTVKFTLLTAADADTPSIQFTSAEAAVVSEYYYDKYGENLASTDDGGSYVYYAATDIIKDIVLFQKVFLSQNSGVSGTLTAGFDDLYTLTIAERSAKNHNETDLSNLGISSLEGLQFFTGLFDGLSLNLTSNVIVDTQGNPDLSIIAGLNGLTGLILSGPKYDFTQLLDDLQNPTLKSLVDLNVSGCSGLSDDDTISALYRIYLIMPNVVINNGGAWNPYAEAYLQKNMLPSIIVINNINQIYSLSKDGNYYFSSVLYDVHTVDFYVHDASINYRGGISGGTYGAANTGSAGNVLDGSLAVVVQTQTIPARSFNIATQAIPIPAHSPSIATGIQAVTIPAVLGTVYFTATITAYDGRTATSIIQTSVQIVVKTEIDENIFVIDYQPLNEAARLVPLTVIFPGRSLRIAVLSQLSSLFTTTVSNEDAETLAEGGGYFYDKGTGKYYISMKTILDLEPPSTRVIIDGTGYSSLSYGGIEYTGLLAISGLKYTSITDVLISRDARLGDGSEIVNLEKLQILMSYVELTTLDPNIVFEKMTELKFGEIGSGSVSQANRAFVVIDKDGTNYLTNARFKNLTTLYILQSGVKEWGFLDGLTGKNTISTFYIYSSSAGNQYFRNANSNIPATEEIVEKIYNNCSSTLTKDYRIGSYSSATSQTQLYTPASWESSKPQTLITDLEINVNNEFAALAANITGLDVRFPSANLQIDSLISNTSVLKDVTNSAVTTAYRNIAGKELSTVNPTLFLAGSTYNSYYGTSYGDVATTTTTTVGGTFQRAFRIIWTFYGINAASANLLFQTPSNVTFVDLPAEQSAFRSTNTSYVSACRLVYNTDAQTGDITLTLNSTIATDSFFIIEGVIGTNDNVLYVAGNTSTSTGYYDVKYASISNNASYNPRLTDFVPHSFGSAYQSFIFPILVRNSSANLTAPKPVAPVDYLSFAEFDDMALRVAIFILLASSGSGGKSGFIYGGSETTIGGVISAELAKTYTGLNISNSISTSIYVDNANGTSTTQPFKAAANATATGYILSRSTVTNTTNTSTPTSPNFLSPSVTHFTFANDQRLSQYLLNISSLTGLGAVFPNLKVIIMEYQKITSIEGLQPLFGTLERLLLAGNNISDVSVLHGFKNLMQVDLSRNILDTIISKYMVDGESVSVFYASQGLFALNLSYNTRISHEDIKALAKTKFTRSASNSVVWHYNPVAQSKLVTDFFLNIFYTACMYDELTFDALNTLINNATTTTFDIYLTYALDNSIAGAVAYSRVTKTIFNNFYDAVFVNRLTTLKTLMTEGVTVGSNPQASETTSNAKLKYEYLSLAATSLTGTPVGSSYTYLSYAYMTENPTIILQVSMSTNNTTTSTSYYNFVVRFKIPLKFGDANTIYKFRFDTNSVENPNDPDNDGVLTASEFEPSTWYYIVNLLMAQSKSFSNGYYTINPTSTAVTTFSYIKTADLGLSSFKGINQLPIKEISFFAPYMSELWTGSFPTLEDIAIRGTYLLDEDDWAKALVGLIRQGMPSITIDLQDCDLNYTKKLSSELTDSLGNTYTTLGAIIAKILNLAFEIGNTGTVYFSPKYNLDVFLPVSVKTNRSYFNSMSDKMTAYYLNASQSFLGNALTNVVANNSSLYIHSDTLLYVGYSFVTSQGSTTGYLGYTRRPIYKLTTTAVEADVFQDLFYYNHSVSEGSSTSGKGYIYFIQGYRYTATSFSTSNLVSFVSTTANMNRIHIQHAYNSVTTVSFFTRLYNAGGSDTSATNHLIPATINVTNLGTGNEAQYYLPTTMFFEGVKQNISWTISSTNLSNTMVLSTLFQVGPSKNTALIFISSAVLNYGQITSDFSLKFTPSLINYYHTYTAGSTPRVTGLGEFTITIKFPTQTVTTTNIYQPKRLYLQLEEPTEDEIDNKTYGLIPAETIFDSSLLIFTIVEGSLYNVVATGSTAPSASYRITPQKIGDTYNEFYDPDGYYLSYDQIASVKTLFFSAAGSTSVIYNGSGQSSITSINGVEIFKNLKTLFLYNVSPSDLTPIKDLSLEYLFLGYFLTAMNPTTNNIPPIFAVSLAPLINSASTLKTLALTVAGTTEANYYQIELEDLSLIKAFSALTTLTLSTSATQANTSTSILFSNHYTLFAWLQENNPGLITVTSSGDFQVNTDPYIKAATMFNSFDANEFTVMGVDCTANAILAPLVDNESTLVGGILSTRLPAYIYDGGNYHAVTWESGSSAIENCGYIFNSANKQAYKFLGGSVTLNDGDMVSLQLLNLLFYDLDFVSYIYARTISVETLIEIDTTYSYFKYMNLLINARLTMDDYEFTSGYIYDLSKWEIG
ncbi:MAG: hypothetical protein LBE09_06015 [Christensenellaceae bacterium]|jgi:hypothetical protein|nr:hypothetical protein [Christensenellaceae bacterium]